MQLRRLAWFLPLFAVAWPASAQDLGVFADTLSGAQPYVLQSFIRPGSEEVFHARRQLDSTEYVIDYRFGRLWVAGLAAADTIVARYRTWGLALADQYRRPMVLVAAAGADSTAAVAPPAPALPRREAMALTRTGSITRGVLAGNNRDAIIESGLRLRLAGTVAKDVRVQAVLTDESTPILPEGTTQRLSELDRVYIEIESTPGQARLGDFPVAFETSEFARLARKVQGAGATVSSPFGGVEGSVEAVGAVARGIFRRERLAIVDGVQGPYRLTGEQNEQFIFIVPGSEEVYRSGRRLQRGEAHDYVIDYATGEVTFTTNRLIRDSDRIVVEYQYRTTQFTRSLVGAASDVTLGRRAVGPARGMLGVTFLREADSRTLNEALGLTADDAALLRAAGDSTAQRSGAVMVAYDPEAPYVQYVKRDTVAAGLPYAIYAVVTRRPTEPVYRVSFTRVGTGLGSYVRQGRTTNGLAYVWRGPGLGDHEPVRILPRPRQHRMLDLRGAVAPVRHLQLYGEWAQSLYDRNRLSDLHESDDASYALLAGARLTPLKIGAGTVALSAERRRTGAGFAVFGRIRPVEFERLWNLNSRRTAATRERVSVELETIDEATLDWQATERSGLQLTAGRIALGEAFRAQRAEATLTVEESRRLQASYWAIGIRSQDDARMERSTWVRQRGRLSMPLFGERLVPQIRVTHRHRQSHVAGTDSLVKPSDGLLQVIPGIRWHLPAGTVGASVDLRTDTDIHEGRVHLESRANTWEVHFDLKPYRTLTVEGRAGVRNRRIGAVFRSIADPGREKSAVVRWSGRFRPWQRAVQLHWFYEALSERTPALQELYIRTGPELGEYVWVDANGNGVIELDEFLPETTQDEGTYVRTLLPSDSLQSVTGLQARLSLNLEPARVWKSALRHVSLRTDVRVQEKSRNPAVRDLYLLRLGTFRSPEHTLKGLLVLQQHVFLFRGVPGYGADLSYRRVRSLSELAAGAESRAIDEYRGEARMKFGERWGGALAVARGAQRTTSESFATRNFDIATLAFTPEVTYSASSNLQIRLKAAHARKSATEVRGSLWKVPLDVRYARARRLNITGSMEVASVTVRGASTGYGLAFFELTDGRGAGTSMMWSLSSWYQLSRVLRATLTYNGRRPQDVPAIHTVRMQLSAIF